MNRAVIVTAGLTLFTLTTVSATDQWPQFRGVQAGVVADDPTLPDSWSETENIAWKVPIPGLGWSSPAVDSPEGFYVLDPAKPALDPLGAVQTADSGYGRIISIAVPTRRTRGVPRSQPCRAAGPCRCTTCPTPRPPSC